MGLYRAVRPALFALPPETAHRVGKAGLRALHATPLLSEFVRARYADHDPAIATERFGIEFPSPVGVAAGFDKNAEVVGGLADLGFGFVEVGTVTPEPQRGNPRPRLFRLRRDRGLINRLGFNGHGVERVRERLEDLGRPPIPLGINIGKMNDSDEDAAVPDYRRVLDRLYPFGDYFVVNVSCPNTPEEYDQEHPDYLAELFAALVDRNDEDKPLLVKIGPDSGRDRLAALVTVVERFGLDGIVATNTSTDRDGLDSRRHADEWGGLSGKPIEDRSTRVVRTLAELTDLPIVGVGGIDSAESAYRKVRAGASLVQVYTGFVYRGPAIASRIEAGLVERLEADGFDSLDDAVGVDAR